MMAMAEHRTRSRDDADRQRRKVVDSYGRIWGWQWREHFGDLAKFPLSSFAGKLMAEGEGALSGAYKPRSYAEVFLGQGLEFAAALKLVRENHREMAWVHYVVDMPWKLKAVEMDIHVNTYNDRRILMQRALLGPLSV